MRWLDGIVGSVAMSPHRFCEIVTDRKAWPAAVHVVAQSDRLRD